MFTLLTASLTTQRVHLLSCLICFHFFLLIHCYIQKYFPWRLVLPLESSESLDSSEYVLSLLVLEASLLLKSTVWLSSAFDIHAFTKPFTINCGLYSTYCTILTSHCTPNSFITGRPRV